MYKSTIIILALSLCILLVMRTQAKPEADSGDRKETSAPTIALTGLDISDKALKLCYKIRNDSKQDIWILIGRGKFDAETPAFMDEDGQTLLLMNRFDVPTSRSSEHIYGKYVRMRPGENQTESISLPIPVHPHYGFTGGRWAQGLEYARRIAIEIGYYDSNLPAMIRGILRETERFSDTKLYDNIPIEDYKDYEKRYAIVEQYFKGFLIKYWFRGLLGFNQVNELLADRDEEILIPYTRQALTGEKVLRITVDGLMIPYEEQEDQPENFSPPDLPLCTKIEIQYQSSILEFFFPYPTEQNLLSPAEKQNLISLRTVVIDDQEQIKALAHDLSLGFPTTGVIRARSTANVVCYREDKCLNSFNIYNDASILVEGKYRFLYSRGFPSLGMFTPKIKPLELRVICANNLKNLWYRFSSYPIIEKTEKPSYPAPSDWCDALMKTYNNIVIDPVVAAIYHIDADTMAQPFICPSAGEGKCHYAMNPNCRPKSPNDRVLLFETKAGWNQHGGPELFTFDNHDPKGGCVLLNDGTVKFIRTEEELHQLRWK